MQLRRGDLGAAQSQLLALLTTWEATDGTAAERARTLLGEIALRRGDVVGALTMLDRANTALRARLGERDADRWLTLALLGLANEAAQQPAAAATAYRAALALGDSGLPKEHPDIARLKALAALGEGRDVLAALSTYADALASRADASAVRARLMTLGPASPSSPAPPGMALLDY